MTRAQKRTRMKRRATKEPEHKIPGWLASACDTFAERAADDTPAGAANKLVQAYSCPLLYRTPKSARWWARKQKVRLTHLELLEVIEEVASANAYAFHRRLIDKVHNLGKGARLLRQSTQDERRTRAVQLAHALLHKAQTDIIGKAKNRWKDVEVRVGRLKASLAAKKGVKGRSTFDYDSPGATNMIRRGEFKGLHMGGCSFGSGKDMMRAVVAHANGVDISEVDGYYAVVSVDAGDIPLDDARRFLDGKKSYQALDAAYYSDRRRDPKNRRIQRKIKCYYVASSDPSLSHRLQDRGPTRRRLLQGGGPAQADQGAHDQMGSLVAREQEGAGAGVSRPVGQVQQQDLREHGRHRQARPRPVPAGRRRAQRGVVQRRDHGV